MKGALGHLLDPCTLQALEVSAAMAAAGASQEDIEEMMAMIMSAGTGGISEDFLLAIKEAMSHGGMLESVNISKLRQMNRWTRFKLSMVGKLEDTKQYFLDL
jgi:hypothetical protein